ncbi:hypothetical protein [Stackebrandtia nassauensis]|nr:hypothetical protein [Stackebrandtia nassauensis]
MPSSTLRRVAAPLVAAALLATAASCASIGGTLTAPAEHTVITKAKDLRPDKPYLSEDGDKPGMLIGPHYKLAVSGYTATTEVPEDNARVYGFDQPMAVPDDSEFFLAIMDGKSQVHSNEKVKAELTVNDKKRPLDRLPGPSEAIAAVIPAKADVKLTVTDEEKSQTINLRDGKRSEQIDGYYNGGLESDDPVDYDSKGKITADAGAQYEKEKRTLNISMKVGAATKAPWIESKGWADKGKVWVSVPISDMTTDSVYGFAPGSHEPGVDWTLKERELFSLNPNEGKATDSKGKESFKADQSSQTTDGTSSLFSPSEVTLLFQVSDKTTKAELKISPRGKMKAVWANVTGSCSWNDKPSAKEISLAFK